MVTINEIKEELEKLGYYATEELIYETYNALCMFENNTPEPGQDIFALMLEGPPGAGKTEFAKTYTKLANNLFKKEVVMVDYQCDATTGKAELFEDLNISAAIRRDADNVNIPGKLIEAIQKVNDGKKVVLFMDEYDKAREETDAFFLQLLQSGKINSIQHGDLEVKEEYKANLQVILCKNDMREELSGPLSRRIRVLRLDYMCPNTFYSIANRVLVEERKNKVNDGLINLVTLMYKNAYDKKEMYNRLPSTSEMLIALTDADRLLKRANAPQNIIYNTIIKNMFKSLDDIKTFESNLKNYSSNEEEKLKNLITEMKNSKTESNKIDLNSMLAEKVFYNESQKLTKKTIEMQNLIDEYKEKFRIMEEKRKQAIEKEIEKIMLENGYLVTNNVPNAIKNFEDESAFIKRGINIFELSNNDWYDIGEFCIINLSHHYLIDKLIEHISELDIKIYENGILLKEENDQKLIVINDLNENNIPRYRFMFNYPVLPATFLSDIEAFIQVTKQISDKQIRTNLQNIHKSSISNSEWYKINTLIYSDSELTFNEISPNVYSIDISDNIVNLEETSEYDALETLIICSSCYDTQNALNASKDIMKKRKVLKHE